MENFNGNSEPIVNLQEEFDMENGLDNAIKDMDEMHEKHYSKSVDELYSNLRDLSLKGSSISYKEADGSISTIEVRKGKIDESISLGTLAPLAVALNEIDNRLNDNVTFTITNDGNSSNNIEVIVENNGDFFINGNKLNNAGKDKVLSKIKSEIEQFKIYTENRESIDAEIYLSQLDRM